VTPGNTFRVEKSKGIQKYLQPEEVAGGKSKYKSKKRKGDAGIKVEESVRIILVGDQDSQSDTG